MEAWKGTGRWKQFMNGFEHQVAQNFRISVLANVPQSVFTESGSHLEGLLESLNFASSFLKLFAAVRLWSRGIDHSRPVCDDINGLHVLLMGLLLQYYADLHPENNYTAPT